MRIANMGQVQVGTFQGSPYLKRQPPRQGAAYLATILDHTGTRETRVEVPSQGFVDVWPQGEGPFHVRLAPVDAAGSPPLETRSLGPDDTVCVFDGPPGVPGQIIVCSAAKSEAV